MKKVRGEAEAYNALIKRRKIVKEKVEEIKKNNSSNVKRQDSFRFDVNTDGLSAKLFFMNLMVGSGKNIVVHSSVSGLITLSLDDVTIEDVLTVVRDVYGFDCKYENTIYTVFPKELRAEVFPINYINVKRVGISDTSVLTGNVESSTQASSQLASQGANLIGDGDAISPGSRIQTRTETDFWVSLDRALSELIGVSGNYAAEGIGKWRKVIANPQPGMAIVTAMPSELASVKAFLDKARLSVKRQVIIEAKILEVQLNDGNQAGVNWNAINGQLLLGKNASESDGSVNITQVSEDVGEIFSLLVRISDVGTLLSLLETKGELQVLSSSRVSTVNNQKAVIRVGSDQFFVIGLSSSMISNASSTTSFPDIELSSFFSGISLDVTPQISDEGSVILHIHPVVSAVTEEQKNIIIGDSAFSLPLALRDVRESDSIVRAKSGQVIVLGGLMQERINRDQAKRPGLSDVPVAGNLFKTQSNSHVKSELIILLKPIVIEQDSWVNDFYKTDARFEQLNPFDALPTSAPNEDFSAPQPSKNNVIHSYENFSDSDFYRSDADSSVSPTEVLSLPSRSSSINKQSLKNIPPDNHVVEKISWLNKDYKENIETEFSEKASSQPFLRSDGKINGETIEKGLPSNDVEKGNSSVELADQSANVYGESVLAIENSPVSYLVKKDSLNIPDNTSGETLFSDKISADKKVISEELLLNKVSKKVAAFTPSYSLITSPVKTRQYSSLVNNNSVNKKLLLSDIDKVNVGFKEFVQSEKSDVTNILYSSFIRNGK